MLPKSRFYKSKELLKNPKVKQNLAVENNPNFGNFQTCLGILDTVSRATDVTFTLMKVVNNRERGKEKERIMKLRLL